MTSLRSPRLSRRVAERTRPGQPLHCPCVQQYGGLIRPSAVVITDQEYPVRPAFSLLAKVPQDCWNSPSSVSFPELATYLSKYQDPRQADAIMRVQQELDETKIVLHKTMESVLQRAERLDTLVDRSSHLSAQSKMFYKTTKKQNSCCVVV